MLTSKQRATLRGIAAHTKPFSRWEKAASAIRWYSRSAMPWRKRELIKMHVLDNCPLDAREAAQELVEKTESEVVQVIGNRLVPVQAAIPKSRW